MDIKPAPVILRLLRIMFGNHGSCVTVEATLEQQWFPYLDPLFNHGNNRSNIIMKTKAHSFLWLSNATDTVLLNNVRKLVI
jgi:hypothetical protein